MMYGFELYYAKLSNSLFDSVNNATDLATLSTKVLAGNPTLTNKWVLLRKENLTPGYAYFFSSKVASTQAENVWKDEKSLIRVEIPYGPYVYHKVDNIKDYLTVVGANQTS